MFGLHKGSAFIYFLCKKISINSNKIVIRKPEEYQINIKINKIAFVVKGKNYINNDSTFNKFVKMIREISTLLTYHTIFLLNCADIPFNETKVIPS
jgi:hypothetical protein